MTRVSFIPCETGVVIRDELLAAEGRMRQVAWLRTVSDSHGLLAGFALQGGACAILLEESGSVFARLRLELE